MGQRAVTTLDCLQRLFELAGDQSGVSDLQVQQALGHIQAACAQVEDDGDVSGLRNAAMSATQRFLITRCWNKNPIGLTKPVDQKLRAVALKACADLGAKLKLLPADAVSKSLGIDS
jgi:hypothetical protein